MPGWIATDATVSGILQDRYMKIIVLLFLFLIFTTNGNSREVRLFPSEKAFNNYTKILTKRSLLGSAAVSEKAFLSATEFMLFSLPNPILLIDREYAKQFVSCGSTC